MTAADDVGWAPGGVGPLEPTPDTRSPPRSTRIGETVAAELRGLTWAEFRPEIDAGVVLGEGPLATPLSEEEEAEEALAEFLSLLFEVVELTDRLLRAMRRARTANK